MRFKTLLAAVAATFVSASYSTAQIVSVNFNGGWGLIGPACVSTFVDMNVGIVISNDFNVLDPVDGSLADGAAVADVTSGNFFGIGGWNHSGNGSGTAFSNGNTVTGQANLTNTCIELIARAAGTGTAGVRAIVSGRPPQLNVAGTPRGTAGSSVTFDTSITAPITASAAIAVGSAGTNTPPTAAFGLVSGVNTFVLTMTAQARVQIQALVAGDFIQIGAMSGTRALIDLN